MSYVKYTRQQVILHWVSAVVILWATISGFYVALAPVSNEVLVHVSFINVSLTTLFIPVFCVRWYLRYTRAGPIGADGNRSTARLAHCVHEIIYWVTATVLVTGILMMDRPIDVFGWVQLSHLVSDPQWLARFNGLHIAACIVLAGLVAIHVAAVVMHELSGRRLLKRMSI
ncbi:Prokaryotic cytochrome b561 [compost metagenome]